MLNRLHAAPALRSEAPYTIRSTRAHTAAMAHMAHGSRVTTRECPVSRQSPTRRPPRPVAVEDPRSHRDVAMLCRRPGGGDGESHRIVEGGRHVLPTLSRHP